MKRLGPVILIIAAIVLAGSIAYEFYQTSTRPSNKAMELMVPNNKKAGKVPVNPANTVTVLLGSDNFFFAYKGSEINNGKILDSTSFQEYLGEIKNQVAADDLVVMVKPAINVSDARVLRLLDQLGKSGISRYGVGGFFDSDKRIIDSLKKQ